MKRRVVLFIVFLFLGAIVNVAVAWGFAAARESMNIERNEQGGFVIWNRPWQIVQQRRFGLTDVWWYDLHQETSQSISPEEIIAEMEESQKHRQEHGPPMPSGRSVVLLTKRPTWGTFGGNRLPDDVFMGGDIGFGFPKVSMWMSTTNDMIGNMTSNVQLHSGWHIRGQIESRSNRFIALPLQITWSGFIINTLFYALLLWLLFFAPFAIRRALRRKRRLCEKCAYPIGVSPVCTECGAALPRKVET